MMCEYIYRKTEVGNCIRERRRSLGLTQEQLAEKIDKSWRFMVDLERGKVGMATMRFCSDMGGNGMRTIFTFATARPGCAVAVAY